MQAFNQIGLLVLVISLQYIKIEAGGKVNSDKAQKMKLPPCRACKIFYESFKQGLDRTSKYKFEGGDTAWEEKNLGSYAHSEVRFVEIHENLCSEVIEGKDQCYQVLEEYDEALETWWFTKQKDEPDLYKHLCINTFQVCCPENHFGKDCTPCQGYPDNICHKNGKCKGSGTRKGNGKCVCDKGYSGDFCDICADGFYESYRDTEKILCSPCHVSCVGKCTKAGSTGCENCKDGWMNNKDRGCTDVNECLMGKSPCSPSQFCVNTEGSYQCMDCHQSCLGCTGDSPDECINCASGFRRKDKLCVNVNDEERQNYISMTRYFTYFGLCLCTCIILNKNVSLAAVVGVCVGIYITLSEYMVNSPDAPKADLSEQLTDQIKKAFSAQ